MADRTHSHDTSTPAMSDETVPSEEAAKLVYEAMVWARDQQPGVPVPKWIDGGNSDAQYEARRVIRKIADLSASHLAKEGGEAGARRKRVSELMAPIMELSEDELILLRHSLPVETLARLRAVLPQPSPALAKGGDAVRLLPCPFCGGEPTLHPHSPDHKLGAWASCSTCGLESPTETGQSVEVAVQHWNTRAALTNRSTRPAEPAAPVAEAGDGEVVGWFCLDLAAGGVKGFTFSESLAKQRDGYRYLGQLAWEVYPVVRLSTLEAERARADELHWKRDFWENRGNKAFQRLAAAKTELAASGRCIDDLTARLAAAEQRAADALARAEKAEGEIAEAERREKWELEQAKINRRHHDAKVHSYVIAELGIIRIKLAEARVSREAQPATDGGDNG